MSRIEDFVQELAEAVDQLTERVEKLEAGKAAAKPRARKSTKKKSD